MPVRLENKKPSGWKIVMYLKDHYDAVNNPRDTSAQSYVLDDVFLFDKKLVNHLINRALWFGQVDILFAQDFEMLDELVQEAEAGISYFELNDPLSDTGITVFNVEPS
jgi:hypothetical protein